MKLLKQQRGFALVEILLAMGVTALVTGVIGTAIFQIYDRSASGQDTLRALSDIQNAGQWIYLDGEKAESSNLIDNAAPVSSMTLSWTTEGTPHTATYTLTGPALIRNHNGVETTVARYLSGADFAILNDLITINLTSAPGNGGVSKQVTYNVWVRPYN
ncbi:MAG: type II secretion system protein [Chloroflexi bacterium]|nr:type II secretion system protein [Chloroflexota bacterium]MCH8869793.1 type II secretion system protein [Chloroflexota bacterium]MCH9039552.1 type II secretion system protein [Chloroflexota bacterium]MCI0770565.1 type II secretion system protein [Chloroflexota bacterium]MCI0790661.1 type II secretion system protein [Chloroflexota bacterium]